MWNDQKKKGEPQQQFSRQGIKNYGKRQIHTVIADRGFLDDRSLWELKHKLGIGFVITSKAGMIVMMALAQGNGYMEKGNAKDME